MQVGKLNPYNNAKISFDGWQEIGHFTSAGSESSWELTVDGDTDLVYKIETRNLSAGAPIYLILNSDTDTNYGNIVIKNESGSITTSKATNASFISESSIHLGFGHCLLSAKSGIERMALGMFTKYLSGTTVSWYVKYVGSWSNTADNLTLMTFSPSAGNFTSGSEIIVYARREA